MNDLTVIKNEQGQLLVDSREVAAMVGKRHSDLLESIKGYIGHLTDGKFRSSDFFIKSTYVDTKGETRNCYLLTRKGCDMVANKMTGEKGVLFTAAYVTKFEEMEQQLKPTCIEDVLISSLQEMKALKHEVQAIKKSNEETKEEIQGIRDIIEINPSAAWRKEVNRLLNAIGKKINNYNLPKNESYNALKDRAKCRPNVLVENLKKRAINNGMAPSKVSQLNMLDVLENDSRLREIYVAIVKDMAIKHGVRM